MSRFKIKFDNDQNIMTVTVPKTTVKKCLGWEGPSWREHFVKLYTTELSAVPDSFYRTFLDNEGWSDIWKPDTGSLHSFFLAEICDTVNDLAKYEITIGLNGVQ